MNTVPICLCHECSKDCHLPDCQLLAYVRELERDKARLDWVDDQAFSLTDSACAGWRVEAIRHISSGPTRRLRDAIDAAMQAMKEVK